MIITISGTPGSGKSSAVNIIAKKLGLKKYSVGDFRREKAKSLGMTLEEYNKMGEEKDFTDKEADEWQINIGKTQDNFVIDSRLGFHFIPNSTKIFLDVSPEEGAKRIMKDGRKEEKCLNLKHAIELWKRRMESDAKRYKKYYSLNPYDASNYDLVLDTSNLTKQEIINKLMEFLTKRVK